jgi:hypothetical protein
MNTRASSPHVGLAVRGVVLKEEKVKWEEIGGPQATRFEGLNPKQGKPRCI